MKKIIIISLIFNTLWIYQIMAQNAGNAVMFSRYYSGGTARSAGMSGAFGALGGDLSVLSANPAGLAVYRGSEFTFTPGFNFSSTNAASLRNPTTFNDKHSNVVINNIGYVYTKNMYNEKGLQTVSFGIAYNRLSDFNSNAYIKQSAAKTSLLDEFVMYANGYNDRTGKYGIPLSEDDLYSGISSFYEGLAYDTYAIDWGENRNAYYSDYDINDCNQPWYRSMTTRGGIGEYAFSLGLNFNHTLFWGATFGIQDVSYRESFYHEETPDFEYMKQFKFKQELQHNGVGLNFKTGIIYRPVQALRFGLSIHTPTHLWLKRYLLTEMETSWNRSPADDGTTHYSPLPVENDPYDNKYKISTPWRYNLSVASVIGQFGLIDVDIEMVNYSNNYILPKSDYDYDNDDISRILKTCMNVRTGAEFRLGPVFLRGGVAYYGNPYQKNQFNETIKETLKGTMNYSGGIGFRNRDFYMDAAYSFMKNPERINTLYMSYNEDEQAKLQTNAGKFILTFGFKF